MLTDLSPQSLRWATWVAHQVLKEYILSNHKWHKQGATKLLNKY